MKHDADDAAGGLRKHWSVTEDTQDAHLLPAVLKDALPLPPRPPTASNALLPAPGHLSDRWDHGSTGRRPVATLRPPRARSCGGRQPWPQGRGPPGCSSSAKGGSSSPASLRRMMVPLGTLISTSAPLAPCRLEPPPAVPGAPR